jgi:hypothetical protein
MTPSVPDRPPGLRMTQNVLAPQSIGEDVWIVEETFSELQIPGVAKKLRRSELNTLHARRSDLQRPGAVRVPCQTSYTSIVG